VRNRDQDATRDGDVIPNPRRFSNRLWHVLGMQLRHPSGIIGSLVGWFMAIANNGPNRLAIGALELEPTDRVLELGFGPGWGLRTIAAGVPDGWVFGVDQSDAMLRQATSINQAAIAEGRMGLLKGPFRPLPWTDSTFNKILLVNVAYFFDSDGQDMAEVYRVLKLGGRIVIYVTSRETMIKWPFAGPETHKIYDRKELFDLLEGAGFRPPDIDIRQLQLPLGIKGLLATAEKSHRHSWR
jgi:SAM-dependent methyltransferase